LPYLSTRGKPGLSVPENFQAVLLLKYFSIELKMKKTTQNKDSEKKLSLFGDSPLEAYDEGYSLELIKGRNPHIGALLSADRAENYITILYRLLLFKREHELEPLYEDIFNAVSYAMEKTGLDEYTLERFYSDMKQLTEWELLDFRIEKERLRGYRDNRKRKFRYRISDEAVYFLHWLEERLIDDLHEGGNDARDLMQEVCGALSELLRLLHQIKPPPPEPEKKTTSGDPEPYIKKPGVQKSPPSNNRLNNTTGQEDIARRVLFQLSKTDDLAQAITSTLIEFNGRLFSFLIGRYDIEEVKQILEELNNYVESFLRQTYQLRLEISPLLERLLKKKLKNKLKYCFEIMEAERLRTPHLLRIRRDVAGLRIPERLQGLFFEGGQLDQLLHRINESAIKVWQKLRSHLRELERKNNRLEDLRDRINEISQLKEEEVPHEFFQELLAPAIMYCDSNFWDNSQRAEPPEPRRKFEDKKSFPKNYLSEKKKGDKPVQTMDEERLEKLRLWLTQKVISPGLKQEKISRGNYDCFDDYQKIMDIAKSGYLEKGKRLARIGYEIEKENNDFSELSFCGQKLSYQDIIIKVKEK
jgi:hypothetical protein